MAAMGGAGLPGACTVGVWPTGGPVRSGGTMGWGGAATTCVLGTRLPSAGAGALTTPPSRAESPKAWPMAQGAC